ncbi:response regulator receiver domain-containing protein [Colletotrichum abscissum]|uniref:Response regulator receiver domain-containing protein n=1 Tax=Colletotrichum abscissum TaxID=1671311 RepID=A0A9P9X3H3_9PEZI|nr:response regulator receiver domain-containing protein [Colletotrichum abscissum]KAI3534695.1 response regulator receiver domain-containing protein [Colletotrichum abscissum]KAK1487472.1 response regulator receiver domain-containing protein [Colletotrichum abscissum]
MGTAGDIRARLRAKFSRRNSAAPSLASNKSTGDAHNSQATDGTSLTRQSSAVASASAPRSRASSQHPPHTPISPLPSRSPTPHEPHHHLQTQPQSTTLQPPGSSHDDHLLQPKLKAITAEGSAAGAAEGEADSEEGQLPPQSSSSSKSHLLDHQQKQRHEPQINHDSHGDEENNFHDAPLSSDEVLVREENPVATANTGTNNEQRPASSASASASNKVRDNSTGTGDDDQDAHKPHPDLDLDRDSLAPMPPAASQGRLASELTASNDLRPAATTTTATTTTPPTAAPTTLNNLPSIHEDQTPPGFDDTKQRLHLSQSDHSHQPLPPKFGAAPTVTLQAVSAEDLNDDQHDPLSHALGTPTPLATAILPSSPLSSRPEAPPRRQSLIPNRQTTLIRNLLEGRVENEARPASADSLLPNIANMVTRKVWVRRPGASATLITVNEDDLVDDVRDMILRKYANSLGRHFDSPDLTLRICPREQRQDRMLGPEEPVGRTLDAYFPGGQNVEEALVIDIPARRTPRPSPRAPTHATTIYYNDEGRPSEAGEGYFPPVANAAALPSPNLPVPIVAPVTVPATHPAHPAHPVHPAHALTAHTQHSIAILGTGQVPPIPSPGGTRSRAYRERPERPRLGRTHTSSPTILNQVNAQSMAAAAAAAAHPTHSFHPRLPPSRTQSNTSEQSNAQPAAPPLPTPPAPEVQPARVATPPPRIASPRPASSRPKKKKTVDHPTLPAGILNGGVPPINVLIVEDNPINLKLLEAFVKRLKVRWKTAVNGRDAVTMWRTGGFHLVLMDIQLPIMSGLEATREIRRLERVNSIGVFSSSAGSAPEAPNGEPEEKDKLTNMELFKSPVIIVALTASSLQSDRHEALAAGCNDFLTKPVNFVWLERKVMEWGCMQALIDFDGWRRWKDFSQQNDEAEAKKSAALKTKAKKNRLSMTSVPA